MSNVEIKSTWDTCLVTERIFVRFVGTVAINGESAEQIAEGIQSFLTHCKNECRFLSHGESTLIDNEAPLQTWAFTCSEGMKLQWNCTPIMRYEQAHDRNGRDNYINNVLEVRGYVPW